MLTKVTKALRSDEILSLLFFAVAACVSTVYGYPLRYYILTDIICSYLLVLPIFFVFLFYAHVKNPYLKFAWTTLALGPATCIFLVMIWHDLYGSCDIVSVIWILRTTLVFWGGAIIIYLLKRPKQSQPLFSDLKNRAFILNVFRFVRDWFPIFVILFAYITLKSIIPVVNARLYDHQFNAMDYFLFLKHYPTELSIQWIPVSWTGLLSFGYRFYFLLNIIAFSSIYCAVSDRRIFYRMVIAFSLTYILGLSLYFCFPAQGPIYHYPDQFEVIRSPMSETSTYEFQRSLWTVYEQVKQHTPKDFCELTKDSGVLSGIAAFPSLHIAVSCVLLYFLFRYHRVIFWLCFLPFWLMVVSTVYFGWHYVVDNIAGFILACVVLHLVKRMTHDTKG
jgi:membrane-associated phospholipid phosphatase